MVESGLTAVYVVALLASGAVALGVGVWAYVTTDVEERRLFLGLMGLDATWTLVAALGLLTTDPTATLVLAHAQVLVALVVITVWYGFATVYTGRSLREWRHVAVLAPIVVTALALVTNPLHWLHWTATTYRAEPISYIETATGPLEIAGNLWAFVVIGVSLYYLGELFVKSRHRTSASLFVLLAGTIAASIPNVLSNLGLVPVPGYDHSVFGVGAFVVAAGYAIFGLGMFDIRPIARDNLIDEVDDALLALDEDGHLVDYNAASKRLFKDGVDDPIGRPLSDVCAPVQAALDLSTTDDSRTTEIVTVTRSGEQTHYSGHVTPITESDDVVGYSVVLRDVTAQIEYQRELERRNEQLDQFASAVAHDLRNPLQVAFGRTRVLEEELDNSPQVNGEFEASLSSLDNSLERMDDIISDLRTLAEKGKSVESVSAVSFDDVTREAWERITADGATLEIESTGTLKADRSRLLSILENLFRNSLEHAGPGVTCRVGLTDAGFYVADDGPGIQPEERPRIFEYGYSGSDDGTGLGLTIVETMASAHGWEVVVTESGDGGARFVVDGASVSLEAA